MGQNKHPVIGYGYGFEFVYGFCERADYCSGYKMGGELLWQGKAYAGNSIRVVTGKRGDMHQSKFTGISSVTLYMGGYSTPNDLWSGLKYKNTVIAHFHKGEMGGGPNKWFGNAPDSVVGAFVGDNARAIPEYEFRFNRYRILNVPAPGTQAQIRNGLNPVFIIVDLLVNQLNIAKEQLDSVSFSHASGVMWNEGLGMSMIITKAKKVKDWIQDILRYMDAVLYYDPTIELFILKTLRADYDVNTLPVFDEDIINDLVFEKGSWSTVVSTFTFKYAEAWYDQVDTYTVTNQAAIQVNGYENAKSFEYIYASDFTSLNHIIPRTVSKHGKPGVKAKFKVNFMVGSTVRPGDVIKLKSIKTDYSTVMRVTKVSADKSDSPFIEIDAVNDIYSTNYTYDPVDLLPPPPPPANPIITTPVYTFIQKLPEEYLVGMDEAQYNDKPFIVVGTPTLPNEAISSIKAETSDGSTYSSEPWFAAPIISASKGSFQDFSEIGYNRDFQVILDNSQGRFTANVNLTEELFQKGGIQLTTARATYPTVLVKSLEVLGYDSATGSYDNSTVRLTGFLDVLNSDASTWYTGATDVQHAVNWGSTFDSMVYLRVKSTIDTSELFFSTGVSSHCSSSYVPAETLLVSYTNSYTATGELAVELNDCYTLWRAYKVSGIVVTYDDSVSGSEKYIVKFRPTHPGEGGSYQDSDSWNGSNKEGITYGNFAIQKVTSSGSVTGVEYDISVTHADSDGYVTVEIPKAVAETQRYWGVYNYFDGFGHNVGDGSYTNAGRGSVYFEII